MAQSQNEKPVQTLAQAFADLHDKVIVQSGPLNTKETVGRLYNFFIPRRFAANANEIVAFIAANWDGKREANGKFGDFKNVAEKIAAIETFLETKWSPKEAGLKSPVEQAVFDRLVEKYSGDLEKLTPAEIDKALLPAVTAAINDPAQTERGISLVENAVNKLRAWSEPRSRKGEKSEVPVFSLDNISL